MVRGAADKEANNIQARLPVARDMERRVRCSATKKKNKNGLGEKPKLDNARKLTGIYFTDPADAEFKETIFKKSAEKVGSSDASSNALQDQDRNVQGNLSQS